MTSTLWLEGYGGLTDLLSKPQGRLFLQKIMKSVLPEASPKAICFKKKLSCYVLVSLIRHNLIPSFCGQTGYRADRANAIPQCIDTQPPPTQRRRTQESESTTDKLIENLDVTASPCHEGDSRHRLNTICSLRSIHPSPVSQTRAITPP